MYRRINISLSRQTLEKLDRFIPQGERSRFIDEAIQYYIDQLHKERLREQLKEGAVRRAERDRSLAEDWFAFEEEAWQQNAAP